MNAIKSISRSMGRSAIGFSCGWILSGAWITGALSVRELATCVVIILIGAALHSVK